MKNALLFIILMLTIMSLITIAKEMIPVIEQECKNNGPISFYYRSEGLCLGSDLEGMYDKTDSEPGK